MKKSLCIVFIFLLSLATPMLASVQSQTTDGIEVLHTAVNPANNNTYHLLSAASWEDSASFARSLDGFLTTVDDDSEIPGSSTLLHHGIINLVIFGLVSQTLQERVIIGGMTEHHSSIATGVMHNPLQVGMKITFTSQAPIWATSCQVRGMIWKMTLNTSRFTVL